MTDCLLLTGATGLLGRYLLRDFLANGVPVAALVRPGRRQTAAERLDAVVRHWEDQMGRELPRPVCLEGDVAVPGLGLSSEDSAWAERHCGRVLHSAASLEFRGKQPWQTNRDGTGHVLELCRRSGWRELHYVSTAYVCGRREGPVRESDLECGQSFRNDYENSKYEAERLIRSAAGVTATVYRPGVIVGDARSGYTSTYHGPYAAWRFAALLCEHAAADATGRRLLPIRLNLTGRERRNLVSVDWTSAVIAHVVVEPRHHGRTYHLTPDRPATSADVEAAGAEVLGFHGPRFLGPGWLNNATLNEFEARFYDAVANYEPYWAGEPEFDAANTRAAARDLPPPRVDRALLRRLIEFAVRDRWGKGRADAG